MVGMKKATLTIIAPAGAKFTFLHTNGDEFSVDIDGGEKFVGEITAGNIINQILPVTLSITDYDASLVSGSGTGSKGKNIGSRTAATILTTATATATSMIMMRSSHKQYTPLVVGAGIAAAMLPTLDTVSAATCTAPSVTITLPIKGTGREIYVDISKTQVETVVCPTGYVFHPLNGCSDFRGMYKRVYTNGTGCSDAAPTDITVTSAQGNFVTLSDNMMVPFTNDFYWGSSQTKFNTTLSNGQQAAVTAWTASDSGLGFVAVDFTTSTLTCKAAYNCISGSCKDQQKAGTTRCALYSFQSNSSYCYIRNGGAAAPTFFPGASSTYACPALSCDLWCPENVTASGVECSVSSCPSNIDVCSSRCFCPSIGPVAIGHMIIPGASSIIMLIIATVAVTITGTMGIGIGIGMDGDTQAE